MTIILNPEYTTLILIGVMFFFCFIYTKIKNKNIRIVLTILVLMSTGLMIIAATSLFGKIFFKYALNYSVIESNSITSSDAMITILTAMLGTVFVYMFSERK